MLDIRIQKTGVELPKERLTASFGHRRIHLPCGLIPGRELVNQANMVWVVFCPPSVSSIPTVPVVPQ